MTHHHHGHHHKAKLRVFFIPNTVPYGALNLMADEAAAIRKAFLTWYPHISDTLKEFSRDRLESIAALKRLIENGGDIKTMTTQPIQPPSGAVTQLVIGDLVGILVAVLEADDSGADLFAPIGPLQYVVSDPSNTVKQGVAADGVTPTFLDNGSGNTGNVSVQVTDAGNNLVGTASFAVVAKTPPPPPPAATQLGVFFVPNTAGSSSAGAASTSAATADAVKKAQTDAGIVVNDPHNPVK